MGISRSAATVIAYAMKEYGWDLKKAFDYVKERRTVTKPNPSFMRQLEEYQGILMARYTHTDTHTDIHGNANIDTGRKNFNFMQRILRSDMLLHFHFLPQQAEAQQTVAFSL